MHSELRAAALVALLASAACAPGSDDVSMDGVWRIEGVARAAAGTCRMIGDFDVRGSTSEGFGGAGMLTLSGEMDNESFERNGSASVYPDRLHSAEPERPIGVFQFRQTGKSEPDLVSGTWTCLLDHTGGWDPVYAPGHWVMRRILREPVDAARLLAPF